MARSDPDKLAQALRANLRRRKEQGRGMLDGAADGTVEPLPEPEREPEPRL